MLFDPTSAPVGQPPSLPLALPPALPALTNGHNQSNETVFACARNWAVLRQALDELLG